MENSVPKVGRRIRAIREQRKLSLRALAEQCSLSVNAISLIERGENSPTVSSLHALATALEVKIADFFEETREEAAVVVVRHEQRLVTQEHGCLMESLGLGLQNQQIEPFLVTIAPSDGEISEPIVHPGQEFVYCLEGEVQYRIGAQTYSLRPGDSLLFDATQPHGFWNIGSAFARMVLVFQAVEDVHLARKRHLAAGVVEDTV
jgi:transcriptional regulator with XRE-family HTH domain